MTAANATLLPPIDFNYLTQRALPHQLLSEGGMVCLVLPGWPLPPGYDRAAADLLVRLPAGYPDVPPDMWWFDPALKLVNGTVPPATESVETHLGRVWQRWSRHLEAGQWNSGIDGLESYLALISRDLRKWPTSS